MTQRVRTEHLATILDSARQRTLELVDGVDAEQLIDIDGLVFHGSDPGW